MVTWTGWDPAWLCCCRLLVQTPEQTKTLPSLKWKMQFCKLLWGSWLKAEMPSIEILSVDGSGVERRANWSCFLRQKSEDYNPLSNLWNSPAPDPIAFILNERSIPIFHSWHSVYPKSYFIVPPISYSLISFLLLLSGLPPRVISPHSSELAAGVTAYFLSMVSSWPEATGFIPKTERDCSIFHLLRQLQW